MNVSTSQTKPARNAGHARTQTRPLATYESLWARGFDAAFAFVQRGWLADFRMKLPDSLPDPEVPWVYVGNHPSNWDGFLMRQIHQRLRAQDPVYTLMLEAELKGLPFFRRIGALGLEPGKTGRTASLLRFLRARRGENGRFGLVAFPQGTLTPSTRFPLEFRRGIEAFVGAVAPAQVFPIAFHLDFEKGMRPTAHARVGKAWRVDGPVPAEAIEARVAATVRELLLERGALAPEAALYPVPEDSPSADTPPEEVAVAAKASEGREESTRPSQAKRARPQEVGAWNR